MDAVDERSGQHDLSTSVVPFVDSEQRVGESDSRDRRDSKAWPSKMLDEADTAGVPSMLIMHAASKPPAQAAAPRPPRVYEPYRIQSHKQVGEKLEAREKKSERQGRSHGEAGEKTKQSYHQAERVERERGPGVRSVQFLDQPDVPRPSRSRIQTPLKEAPPRVPAQHPPGAIPSSQQPRPLTGMTAQNRPVKQSDVECYALILGMDPQEDRNLLWVAEQALTAPLPPHWKEMLAASGATVFQNTITGALSWTHPLEDHYKTMFQYYKDLERQKMERGEPTEDEPEVLEVDETEVEDLEETDLELQERGLLLGEISQAASAQRDQMMQEVKLDLDREINKIRPSTLATHHPGLGPSTFVPVLSPTRSSGHSEFLSPYMGLPASPKALKNADVRIQTPSLNRSKSAVVDPPPPSSGAPRPRPKKHPSKLSEVQVQKSELSENWEIAVERRALSYGDENTREEVEQFSKEVDGKKDSAMTKLHGVLEMLQKGLKMLNQTKEMPNTNKTSPARTRQLALPAPTSHPALPASASHPALADHANNGAMTVYAIAAAIAQQGSLEPSDGIGLGINLEWMGKERWKRIFTSPSYRTVLYFYDDNFVCIRCSSKPEHTLNHTTCALLEYYQTTGLPYGTTTGTSTRLSPVQ